MPLHSGCFGAPACQHQVATYDGKQSMPSSNWHLQPPTADLHLLIKLHMQFKVLTPCRSGPKQC